MLDYGIGRYDASMFGFDTGLYIMLGLIYATGQADVTGLDFGLARYTWYATPSEIHLVWYTCFSVIVITTVCAGSSQTW